MACKRNRVRMRLYEIRKKEAKTFIWYRNLGLSVLNAEILIKTCYDVTKQQKKKKEDGTCYKQIFNFFSSNNAFQRGMADDTHILNVYVNPQFPWMIWLSYDFHSEIAFARYDSEDAVLAHSKQLHVAQRCWWEGKKAADRHRRLLRNTMECSLKRTLC